ncbi:MAG: undecaprenyl-diphosphate phosphatase [Hungatella sp.]|jgi:undecaprenyl-diphosphatase|nr:undecaprenyl-diphosphate phosphatase [Hungatella sp.]MCI9637149.1 undecaprenyl-diphosphate phosphatase [Hungatella sp.]
MSINEVLKVLVFGIVEGFTEWLPISSTGHMILLDDLIHLNVTEEFREVFMVVIQLGAILAVVLLYFKKLNPFVSQKNVRERDMANVWQLGPSSVMIKRHTMILWLKVVIACLPAAIIGIPLDDWMEAHLRSSYIVAAMLILYGILFIVVENQNYGQRPRVERTGQISIRLALYIGLFQVLSLVPGTSRSGATILGAMILGCSRSAAAEFSFFLGIPVMFGASLLKLFKFGFHFTGAEVFTLIFGMVVAFLVSVYSIKFLMSYIRGNDFKLFGYYRIALGVLVILYFGIKGAMAFFG